MDIVVGRIVLAIAPLGAGLIRPTNLVSEFLVTRNRRGDKGSFRETAGRWQQAGHCRSDRSCNSKVDPTMRLMFVFSGFVG